MHIISNKKNIVHPFRYLLTCSIYTIHRALVVGILLLWYCSGAFAQEQLWIKGGNASYSSSNFNYEGTLDMTTDANGNLYVLVKFLGSNSVTFGSHTYNFNFNNLYNQNENKGALIS